MNTESLFGAIVRENRDERLDRSVMSKWYMDDGLGNCDRLRICTIIERFSGRKAHITSIWALYLLFFLIMK